jgi:4-amino-4-deoxy-L-arabinose transferase-like glycosyltransferase
MPQARMVVVVWTAWVCVVLGHYYLAIVRALRGAPLSEFAPKRALLVALLVLSLAGMLRGVGWLRLSLVRAADAMLMVLQPRSLAAVLAVAGIVSIPWLYVREWLARDAMDFSLPYLPFAGEAAARAVTGVIGAVLVLAASLGSGTAVLRLLRCRTGSPGEQVIFATLTGFLVVSYSCFALALAGAYRPFAVAVLIAILCAAGAVAAAGERTTAMSPVDAEAVGESAPWLMLGLVSIGFAFIAALAPEKEYDALWYHLNLPRVWLSAGQPVDLIEEYVSLYPLTWELVFGAGLVLGGVTAAKLLHFVCLPLLAVVVARAARRYVHGASAAIAGALVVVTPTMVWEAGTAYVDVALALHAAAACYALARYAETGERAWAVVAALQFGAAAATKHLGVIVTLAALTVFVGAAMWSGRGALVSLRGALWIGVAAALVPASWYVRSWLASGNPVFPDLFSLFGASPPQRWDAMTEHGLAAFKARFGFGRSPLDLLWLPWDVTVHGARFGGSLGPIFLLLVPGLLMVRRSRYALILVAAGTVAYVGFWASPMSSFQMRFLMPAVAPLALLAAASLHGLAGAAESYGLRARRVLVAGIFVVSLLNLPPFVRLHERDREGWSGWLTHVMRTTPAAVVLGRESEDSYLRRQVPSYGAWQAINARLPADARVLAFVGGDQFYAERRRLSYDATMARPAVSVPAADVPRAADALRALGITHVLFDRRELTRLQGETLALGSTALQQACTVDYDDRRFWVCRLDYERLGGEVSRSANR